MSSRAVIRILLSLLLLLSQQMAFTHALSHWPGASTAAGAGTAASAGTAHTYGMASATDGDRFSAALADQNCDECLVFASLAGTISNTPRWFAVDASGAQAVPGCVSHPAHARTVCVFESRAPPVFA